MAKDPETIEVENINHPGKTHNVDKDKYYVMRAAIFAALPEGSAPVTAADLKEALLPHLDALFFPEGKTAQWWQKCVQLDLEAKGVMQRHDTTPLTFSRVAR
ncbi:hypothetical protein A9Q95_04855 [Rhodobacterales bacterium 59_46_T64]|nr:hypothetical protein A9Q95_04855 [Rhodobacterales bacterium 59_46_T64]